MNEESQSECRHENVTPSWCAFGLCECGERMFRGMRPDMSGPAPWRVNEARNPDRADVRARGWRYDVAALRRLETAASAAKDALLAAKRSIDGNPCGTSTPQRTCPVCRQDRSTAGPLHADGCALVAALDALGNVYVIKGHGAHGDFDGGWTLVDTEATLPAKEPL